jgi:hypothetical protein
MSKDRKEGTGKTKMKGITRVGTALWAGLLKPEGCLRNDTKKGAWDIAEEWKLQKILFVCS